MKNKLYFLANGEFLFNVIQKQEIEKSTSSIEQIVAKIKKDNITTLVVSPGLFQKFATLLEDWVGDTLPTKNTYPAFKGTIIKNDDNNILHISVDKKHVTLIKNSDLENDACIYFDNEAVDRINDIVKGVKPKPIER
jgi:hypothetical protein